MHGNPLVAVSLLINMLSRRQVEEVLDEYAASAVDNQIIGWVKVMADLEREKVFHLLTARLTIYWQC